MRSTLSHLTPGTVSKILWHFTGGPVWNDIKQKQEKKPKESQKALDNLYNIIKTKELQVGKYREVIHYKIPKVTILNLDINKKQYKKNVPSVAESEPVCCVSDIPIQHLSYHSIRYGKFAIAFYRNSILRNNFNPVFYTHNNNLVRYIINSSDYSQHLHKELKSISSHLEKTAKSLHRNSNADKDVLIKVLLASGFLNDYSKKMLGVESTIKYFLSFIKTVNRNEFDTIYCEREWRSISTFKFDFNDVAMITIPRKFFKNNYNEKVREISKKLKIPRQIPIVAWEDLIEH